jgi:NADP-dependent 3-hydroxy acid dehydrogenase YdfG
MTMAGPLATRVALVTGAASGIGAGIAAALAGAGATVVVVARRPERLEALVQGIAAAGGHALALPGDVTHEAFATGVVAETVERYGRLDVLVNSAGTINAGNLEHTNPDEWRRILEVNLLASVYTCHAAIAPMRAQGSGNIINIGSLSCRTTSPIFNPYATSKFGLNAMTDGLRQEVGPLGIRVCMIAPGAVSTEIAGGITDPAIRDGIHQYTHQPGALKPEDIAAAVLFIVSLPPHATVSELWMRATTDVLY